MKLFLGKKVGVSKEEKSLPYYKYFERDLAEIPEDIIKLFERHAEIPALSFDDKNIFLVGDDDNYCNVGYGINADGTGFVANVTYMPGVKSEMLDWWFPWHSVGSDLRYKIWDAEYHYFARYILEDIGFGPSFLKISFKRPADFGLDEKIIGTEKCESLVCGIGDGECAATMIHKWYSHKNGVMLCSRFWIGFADIDGKIIKISKLYAHNIKEFTILRRFCRKFTQRIKIIFKNFFAETVWRKFFVDISREMW